MRFTHAGESNLVEEFGATICNPPARITIYADVLRKLIEQLRPDLEPDEVTLTVAEAIGANSREEWYG
jgi:hypothetical protein